MRSPPVTGVECSAQCRVQERTGGLWRAAVPEGVCQDQRTLAPEWNCSTKAGSCSGLIMYPNSTDPQVQ